MHNSVHRGTHCQKKNWHSRTIPRRKRIDLKKSEGMIRAKHHALSAWCTKNRRRRTTLRQERKTLKMSKIKLWPTTPLYDPALGQPEPYLEPFLTEGSDSCMIVCAGGGYIDWCDYEAYPIAEWLTQIGVNAFALHYRLADYHAPCMLADIQRAIRLIRSRASEFGIDPQKIGAIGFSAGGHLVSSACTHTQNGLEQASDEIDGVDCRLNAAVLCYPVITMGQGGHDGSRIALLGENATEEQIASYSSQLQVKPGFTPPCFLVHTLQDGLVDPFYNTVAFAEALTRAEIPCETHLFAYGRHGVALAREEEYRDGVGQWTALCQTWLKTLGFIQEK